MTLALQAHGVHYDSHARVSVVVSLSDYGREYRGGIYVAHGRASKRNLPLSRGDAVAHQDRVRARVRVRVRVRVGVGVRVRVRVIAPTLTLTLTLTLTPTLALTLT